MVLAAAARNLEGADAVAERHATHERPTSLQPVKQRGTERIAAAGGVDDLGRRDTADVSAHPLLPQVASLRAERDDDAFQMRARQRFEGLAGGRGSPWERRTNPRR